MFWMYCTMGEITRNLVTYIKEKFKRDSSCHLEIFWHPSLFLTGYAWITNCFSYSIQQIIRHRGPVKTKDQGHISWKSWSPDIKDHHPSFSPPTGLSTIIFTMTTISITTSNIIAIRRICWQVAGVDRAAITDGFYAGTNQSPQVIGIKIINDFRNYVVDNLSKAQIRIQNKSKFYSILQPTRFFSLKVFC